MQVSTPTSKIYTDHVTWLAHFGRFEDTKHDLKSNLLIHNTWPRLINVKDKYKCRNFFTKDARHGSSIYKKGFKPLLRDVSCVFGLRNEFCFNRRSIYHFFRLLKIIKLLYHRIHKKDSEGLIDQNIPNLEFSYEFVFSKVNEIRVMYMFVINAGFQRGWLLTRICLGTRY